jgi:hypothetical protein
MDVDHDIMRPGFDEEAYAAGHTAFLETLAAGLPVCYRDETGLLVMEQPDGRRFEIRWLPGRPAGSNYEIIREVGRRAA